MDFEAGSEVSAGGAIFHVKRFFKIDIKIKIEV